MTLDLVLIAVAIAFDPIPLTTFMVVLPAKRGARKGAAFVTGWLVSLAIVVTATVLVTGNRPPRPHTSPATAALAVRIAIGVVLIGAGAATVVEAKLSNWASDLTLAAFCVLASSSYLALEIYAGFRPAQSQAFLARFRTWMDAHTDQVIIAGSLLLGLWLISKSIYLIIT